MSISTIVSYSRPRSLCSFNHVHSLHRLNSTLIKNGSKRNLLWVMDTGNFLLFLLCVLQFTLLSKLISHLTIKRIWLTNQFLILQIRAIILNKMKKEETEKHCALAVVRRSQNFSACRRPLPGGAWWPKFNHLEMVTTFTYKPSLVRIDACNFELSW